MKHGPKIILTILLLLTGFLLAKAGIGAYKYYTDWNTKEREYVCEVIAKEKSQKRYWTEFLLIIRTEGKLTTLTVAPETYVTSQIGDKLTFDLNGQNFGIKETWIGFAVLSPFSGLITLLAFIWVVNPRAS